jgi:hypothetical protein
MRSKLPRLPKVGAILILLMSAESCILALAGLALLVLVVIGLYALAPLPQPSPPAATLATVAPTAARALSSAQPPLGTAVSYLYADSPAVRHPYGYPYLYPHAERAASPWERAAALRDAVPPAIRQRAASLGDTHGCPHPHASACPYQDTRTSHRDAHPHTSSL